jgi:uncharacterized repeat protein (TIGR04138 family)
MMDSEFVQQVEQLAERLGIYRAEAYFWVMRALEFTRRRLRRPGHVTGQELCEGARELALDEYGPMALEVLHHWGIRRTEDMGEIVFQMIEAGLMRKTEEDRKEDFAGVFDFAQAFVQDYRW